jgi:hypothetical protein
MATRAAMVLVMSVASVAGARQDGKLDLQFSYDGSFWQDDAALLPGQSILVRVVMTIPATYYGIGGTRFNVASQHGFGWDSQGNDVVDLSVAKGSATDGRVAGFDFGAQTQQVFENVNSMRIDAKNDTGDNPNAGISAFQAPPTMAGTAFNTNKSAEIYRFKVTTSPDAVSRVQLIFHIADGGPNGSPDQITAFAAYATETSSSPTAIGGTILGDTGALYVPAPGAAVPLALGMLGLGRRSRRTGH